MGVMLKRASPTYYHEPFVGGGGMIKETERFKTLRFCSDINPDLIELFNAAQNGWSPPRFIDLETYQNLKHQLPSLVRTYAQYALSFAGKDFGGLVRTTGRDMQHESFLRFMESVPFIQRCRFQCCSYEEISARAGSIVYCDPPYAGTLSYGQEFDHAKFWEWCRIKKREGVHIFISEFSAPPDFVSIWEQDRKVQVSDTKITKTEKLWRPK